MYRLYLQKLMPFAVAFANGFVFKKRTHFGRDFMENSTLTERRGYGTAAGERERGIHTLHLTIAGTGGSILAQSCQERVGDVAQLVERRNGIAEATGSTPVVSTNPLCTHDYALRSDKPDEHQAICRHHQQFGAASCRASKQFQPGRDRSLGEFDLLHTESFPDYSAARAREKFLKSGKGREWLKMESAVDAKGEVTRPACGG